MCKTPRFYWVSVVLADGLARRLSPGSESSSMFTDLSARSYTDRRGGSVDETGCQYAKAARLNVPSPSSSRKGRKTG
jgi:hypothetical protein